MSTQEMLPLAEQFEESQNRQQQEWRVRELMARQVFFLWVQAVKEAIHAMRSNHQNDMFLHSDIVNQFLRATDEPSFRHQRNEAAHELSHLTYLMGQLNHDLRGSNHIRGIMIRGLEISEGLLEHYGQDHIESSVQQQFHQRMQTSQQPPQMISLPAYATVSNWRSSRR